MPGDHYNRYMEGKRSEVWRELCRLKEDVYSSKVFDDAMSVARTIVERAYRNLQKVHHDLCELEYQFQHPRLAIVPASKKTADAVRMVEKEFGRLPLIMSAWYERFDSLNFNQDPDQLMGKTGPRIVHGLGAVRTIAFPRLQTAFANREKDLEKWLLPFGVSASNCDRIGFYLPNHGADTKIYDEGFGPVTVVSELRNYFRWGCFPSVRFQLEGGSSYGLPRSKIKKLLPQFKKGLIRL